MNEQRLKEIIELAHTVLPITGPIHDADKLKQEATKALLELIVLPNTRQIRHLKDELRFIQREAYLSDEGVIDDLFTDPDSDRGDHDLR